MLVLTRRQSESIFINDSVVVTVLKIRGCQVKIGIEAPREMPVHRKEVHETICGQEVAMGTSWRTRGERG